MDPHRLSPYARNQEKTKLDERRQSRKDRAVPLRTHRPAGVGNPAARRTDAARPRGRLPPLRHSALHAPPGVGGHFTRVDATLSPQRTHCAHSPTAPGPRPDSRRRAGDRRAHRTAQAREPAPHWCRAAARVGARPSRYAVGLHALSFPARSRTYPTSVTARQNHRAQEVRSRARQPDLAVRHAVRSVGSALRTHRVPRQNASVPASHARRCQPPHSACAVLSQSGVGLVSRLPAPGPRRARPSHAPLHGQRQDLPLAGGALWARRASPPPSAFSSSTRRPISPRAAARSSASFVRCASSFSPSSIPKRCCRSNS